MGMPIPYVESMISPVAIQENFMDWGPPEVAVLKKVNPGGNRQTQMDRLPYALQLRC